MAVGLIGHSEGGLIAPMVAARDPKIAFIVLWAGPGAPMIDVIMEQRATLGPGTLYGAACAALAPLPLHPLVLRPAASLARAGLLVLGHFDVDRQAAIVVRCCNRHGRQCDRPERARDRSEQRDA